MGVFSLTFLCFIHGAFLACAQSGLVLPVRNNRREVDVDCQTVYRSVDAKSRSSNPVVPSSEQFDGTVKEQFSHGADSGLIWAVPYRPKCDPNQPHLFQARQCSEYDCFCVNVTTGAVLLGTRASPAEVGNCSAAVYSILLAIRTTSVVPPQSGVDALPLDKNFYPHPVGGRMDTTETSMTAEQDLLWRKRIQNGLETILQSTVGYQRIFNVSPLIAVPSSGTRSVANTNSGGTAGLLYYRAYLLSIGHTSLQAPQDLVQHRLHEGYLPEIGNVDRDISRIELVQANVADPSTLAIWNAPDQPAVSSSQSSKQSIASDEGKPGASKTMSVRSPSPDAFSPAAPAAESPNRKVERDYRQLPLMEDDGRLTEAMIAARQSAVDSIHQPWPARASRVNILRQPGVIAGIVGSVVVVLLLLILLILFCIYRLRKRDEGSYALDEPKKAPSANSYQRAPTREFYA